MHHRRKWFSEHGTAAHRAIVSSGGGLLPAGTVNIPVKPKWDYKASAPYGMG